MIEIESQVYIIEKDCYWKNSKDTTKFERSFFQKDMHQIVSLIENELKTSLGIFYFIVSSPSIFHSRLIELFSSSPSFITFVFPDMTKPTFWNNHPNPVEAYVLFCQFWDKLNSCSNVSIKVANISFYRNIFFLKNSYIVMPFVKGIRSIDTLAYQYEMPHYKEVILVDAAWHLCSSEYKRINDIAYNIVPPKIPYNPLNFPPQMVAKHTRKYVVESIDKIDFKVCKYLSHFSFHLIQPFLESKIHNSQDICLIAVTGNKVLDMLLKSDLSNTKVRIVLANLQSKSFEQIYVKDKVEASLTQSLKMQEFNKYENVSIRLTDNVIFQSLLITEWEEQDICVSNSYSFGVSSNQFKYEYHNNMRTPTTSNQNQSAISTNKSSFERYWTSSLLPIHINDNLDYPICHWSEIQELYRITTEHVLIIPIMQFDHNVQKHVKTIKVFSDIESLAKFPKEFNGIKLDRNLLNIVDQANESALFKPRNSDYFETVKPGIFSRFWTRFFGF